MHTSVKIKNNLFFGFRYILRDNPYCSYKERVLTKHDSWSISQLDEYGKTMLRRSLLAAKNKLNSYAKIKPDIPINQIISFLRDNYPVIQKNDLLNNPLSYYPSECRSYPWTIKGKTSGTTGTPLEVFRSLDSVIWENAFINRHWSWSGFQKGMKRATLRGDAIISIHQKQPPFWVFNRFNNQLILSSRHLKQDTFAFFIEALQQFKPQILQAYPSTAFTLANYMDKVSAPPLAVPYVYTGSEILYPYQREIIEQYIGKVMDFYGMAERVAFASECEFGNMHLNTDYSFVEIVDDGGNPTDDFGYVVGTTFHNQLMPLIRYRLSDRTKWKPGQCPCGRPYPMIEPITGKFEDIIYGSEGQPISPSIVTFAFKGVHSIEKSQVAQTGPGKWEVRIVPSEGYSEEDGKQLIGNIHTLVDENISIQLKRVDDIPRTSAGKYRWVVNESSVSKESI